VATHQSILPFPSDIDRDHFGHWLSGFTDGEGCFFLSIRERRIVLRRNGKSYRLIEANAQLSIGLRWDERPILERIQSFFGCGRVRTGDHRKARARGGNACDQVVFEVRRMSDLLSRIIPHFERYPLRAKKQSDFRIWRDGVMLADEIKTTSRGGPETRWTPERIEEFSAVVERLRANRRCAHTPAN
jgi:hypothetical protein